MSLLFRRRSLERAVQGELAAADDVALLRHLAGCSACRHHYEALLLAQRALEGQPVSRVELERERRRLELALAPTTQGKTRRAWALVPAVAALLALGVLVARVSEPTIVERGGDDGALPFVVSVYAKPKEENGKTRLAAELPISGEARISTRDWVQLKAPAQTVLVLVRDGQAPTLIDASSSTTLEAGTWRLFAITGTTPEAALAAAKAATRSTRRLEVGRTQITGVILVEP